MMDGDNNIKENWIKVTGNTFHCSECENESKILTNTEEGLVEANVEAIKKELTDFPSKVIYAVCDVCGMEYVFRLVNGELYLEPSEEEK